MKRYQALQLPKHIYILREAFKFEKGDVFTFGEGGQKICNALGYARLNCG